MKPELTEQDVDGFIYQRRIVASANGKFLHWVSGLFEIRTGPTGNSECLFCTEDKQEVIREWNENH